MLRIRLGANCYDFDTFGPRSSSQYWLELVAKRVLDTPFVKEWIVRAWTAVHWLMWTGGISGFSFIKYGPAAIHCQNLNKVNRYFWFMWLTNCAHWVLLGRPKGKRPFGRPRHRWDRNIVVYLLEVGWGAMDWIYPAQVRYRWRAVVIVVMNLRVP
jgi:hypothetical protein